jgi:DNA-binding NarL/FixJ family response regulator
MREKIKVAYIEDHKSVKEGINYLLSKQPEIEIVEDEFELARMDQFISMHKISIFILDLQLYTVKQASTLNGYEICEIITRNYPDVKVIAHSMYDHIDSVNAIFSKGAMGFVSKKSGCGELINAIEHVAAGRRYICPEIEHKSKNARNFLKNSDEFLKGTEEPFTRAEKQILEKIAKGFSTKEIAQQFEVSEKTIETHRKHLFVKANVKNAAELIAFTYSRRLLME